MLRRTALSAIWVYQRFVSPRKGYGCAYRLAHGGTGCSGYAKAVIAERGVVWATPFILERFAQCKAAARILQDRGGDQGSDPQTKRKRRWYDYCDLCSGCSCPRGTGGGKDGGADCSPDCTPDCCSL